MKPTKKERNALTFAALFCMGSLLYFAKPYYYHKYSAGQCALTSPISLIEIQETPLFKYKFQNHAIFGSMPAQELEIKKFENEAQAFEFKDCKEFMKKAE